MPSRPDSRSEAELVSDVAGAVLSVRPLVDVLERPVRVASSPGAPAAGPLLSRVADVLGAPPLVADATPERLGIFERIVSERLSCAAWPQPACEAALRTPGLIERSASAALAGAFERRCRPERVVSADGTRFTSYSAGARGAQAVVIASGCGMPAKLCDRWVRFLALDHFVVLWETRGLFGDLAGSELTACDVAAQAADLAAVLDHHGLERAHVMGLCGGAVIALAAAAADPDRVSSLSLWHGDFALGPDGPSTVHQRNLRTLTSMVAGGADARAMHAVFCQAMLARLGTELAHLVVYPYATPLLLSRYFRLADNITGSDVRPLLGRVAQPVLVVTSEDDEQAHPGGSVAVAAALRRSALHVRPHGDHISVFEAGPDLMHLAARFVAEEG